MNENNPYNKFSEGLGEALAVIYIKEGGLVGINKKHFMILLQKN